MNVKKHLPNFITLLNLVCGVFAILFFIQSTNSAQQSVNSLVNPTYSAIEIGIILIGIATLLDFLDGFAARLLRVQSEIGAQLDSLADMVTFGVAPGFLVYASYLKFFPEHSIFPYFNNRYAKDRRDSAVKIGQIRLTSEFNLSTFGDGGVFFRHQRYED